MLCTLDRQFSYGYHSMSYQDPIKFYTLLFYGRDLIKYKKTLVKTQKKKQSWAAVHFTCSNEYMLCAN